MLLSCLWAVTTNGQVDESHVRLTNLPHVYIDTFTGNSITSKNNYVLARMWMVDEKDSVLFFDSLEIKGRGNSTWNLAKKPYKLKFHQKEKLLGKGYAKTKKWTLLANHGDKTLIRNALTSLLGEFVGLDFNPAAKFVDLTLNGNYVGNYQISDHVDVRPHRVNVMEQDYPLTETSNITGGYLLEADGFYDFTNGVTGFYTPNKNAPIRIHYPDEDEIDNSQYRYIRDAVYELENRLYDDAIFKDGTQGYRALIDSTSLANWYIATEVSGNPDGFFSTYFYKDQDDDRFFWGPLWDYDIAYGNDNRIGDTSRKMMKDVGFGASVMRTWAIRFWEDPWFARLINRRYQEIVDAGVEAYMLEKIDSLTTLLQRSQAKNFELWGINKRALRECVLYSTYDQYVSDLRSYVSKHIPYLQTAFADLLPDDPTPPTPPGPKVPDFEADTLVYYAISNAGTGTFIDLNPEDYTICGNARDEESMSQQWRVRPLANGYMHIVNRMTGLALNDPTQGNPTATTLTGTRLNVTEPDSTDTRQQWDIVAQSDDRFNLINHFSQHGANLSGGGSANGTRIVSYISNERNSTSNNRMWRFGIADEVEDAIPSLTNDELEYALAYDPTGQRLHFGANHPEELTFKVNVYDQGGRLVRTFRADGECSTGSLPHGIYIVAWQTGGKLRSTKFAK